MPQLSETDKARALALREAGLKQNIVAQRLGVYVRTIRRLEKAASKLNQGEIRRIEKASFMLNPGDIPKRKPGTGKTKKWGDREVNLIKEMCESNPDITAIQLKLQQPKELGHLSRRTISDIIVNQVGLRSRVKARKPHMTEAKKLERKEWATKHQKWTNAKWGQYLFSDEAFFWTKSETGGRTVRRPVGKRYDPKYTARNYKKPQKLMFWAGITRTGRRISKFLEVNENMNSENFVKILKQARVPDFLKRHNLKLLQDRATPHISKPTSSYLKSQGV